MLTQHQLYTLDRVFWQEIQGISWSQIGHVYLLALLVFIPGIVRMIKKKSTFLEVLLSYWLVVWIGIMLLITIFRREPGYGNNHNVNPFPTWDNFGGNGLSTVFSIYNVILFIPFGFLVRLLKHKSADKKAFGFTMAAGLLSTCAIEITQLITSTGYFEFTDIYNNVLGCFVGDGLAAILLGIHRLLSRLVAFIRKKTTGH